MGRGRPVPIRQPLARLDRRRRRQDRRLRIHRRQRDGRHDRAARQARTSPACRPSTLPELRADPEVRRRRRCASCRRSAADRRCPAPRRVNHPPFVQFEGPTVWSTLALTLHADGRSRVRADRREPVPAALGVRQRRQAERARPGSPISRSGGGTRSASTRRGATRIRRRSSPRWRPRSSASCRRTIMRGGEKPKVRKLKEGARARRAGPARQRAVSPARRRAQRRSRRRVGRRTRTGRIVGERAILEGGRRTSTLRALTPKRSVAVADADQIDARQRCESSARVTAARRPATSERFAFVRRARLDAGVRRASSHASAVIRRASRSRSADELPTLVLDAGTGLQNARPTCSGARPFDGTILLTHLHWDHVQGLPFCPADRPSRRHASSWRSPRKAIRSRCFTRAMSPPHFPIGPDGLRGDWRSHRARSRQAPVRPVRSRRPRCRAQGRPDVRLPNRVPTGRRPAYVPDALDDNDDAILRARGRRRHVRSRHAIRHRERQRADQYGHGTVEHAVEIARRAGRRPARADAPLPRPQRRRRGGHRAPRRRDRRDGRHGLRDLTAFLSPADP